jgi:hypothetical protein
VKEGARERGSEGAREGARDANSLERGVEGKKVSKNGAPRAVWRPRAARHGEHAPCGRGQSI